LEATYLRLFETVGKGLGLLHRGLKMFFSGLPLTSRGRRDSCDRLREAEDRPQHYRSSIDQLASKRIKLPSPEDTWYVAGLKGTGSHHIAISDTVVPAANFFDLAGVPCLLGPLYQAVPQLLPLFLGAISVGIAEGALDELVELANTGRQQFQAAVPLRDSETFQGELGRVAAEVRAVRAFLHAQAESHWRHALAGTLKDDALLAQGTQTAIWLATTCVHAVDACFALGGSSALYESSPLQRRLRDLHAAAQHKAAQPRHYVSAGKVLLGSPVVNSKNTRSIARRTV
jgi:alkylation response protein AidB-like acyl-CoA dehydrogenase